MKRIIALWILLAGTGLIPLACGYDGGTYGTGPRSSGNSPHPLSTLVANPTYTVPTPPYKTSWGTTGGPNALAFGGGTTVYVAEADNSVAMVEVFDSSNPATVLAQWVSYGATALSWPGGVAYNPVNGNIYVTDNLNNAVYEFTAAGVTAGSWTGYGAQSFNAPEGIAADASGNLYVADTGNARVEEFDPNGIPLHQWSSGGGLSFFQPSAVALDSSNDVYVADAGNERYVKFSSGGVTYLGAWPTLNYADIFGIVVDPSGNLFAADYGDGTNQNGNGLVEEYDANGHVIALWGSSVGPSVFGPDAVALSGADVFVGDYNNDLIQVFGP